MELIPILNSLNIKQTEKTLTPLRNLEYIKNNKAQKNHYTNSPKKLF
jgi:hypothetical protein